MPLGLCAKGTLLAVLFSSHKRQRGGRIESCGAVVLDATCREFADKFHNIVPGHNRHGDQVMALYEKIQNDPLEFPQEVNMSSGLRRLLRAMMEKGPDKRITLDQVQTAKSR